MTALRAEVARRVRQAVGGWTAAAPSMTDLNGLLRLLCKWRGQVLAETYFAREGETIYAGPFKGMTYVRAATEGALVPRLLGVYESELHPHIETLAAAGLDCIIDVGCAEGYYAVGLARRMPGVTVHAHDIDQRAVATCRALAVKNGVADRVITGGEFKAEDFQRFAGRRTLVMVDTEGAEVEILQPARGPALAAMWIIVETHDGFTPGALETLRARFAATHDIVQVNGGHKTGDLPGWVMSLGHLDQLLAVWEWRMFPTPWLVMTPKAA